MSLGRKPEEKSGTASKISGKERKPLMAIGKKSCFALVAAAVLAAAVPAMAQQNSQSPLQAGMQAYIQGNFDAAVQDFQTALQQSPEDKLPKMWLGISQIASGNRKDGFFTLSFSTDTVGPLSNTRVELQMLASWHEGETGTAKSLLGFCEDVPLCQKIAKGIDSGASAPDPQDWPKIVGLDKMTAARTTKWTP